MECGPLPVDNISYKLVHASNENMHQVDANDNEDLPGHDLVPAVGEVEHYTGDEDFRDGEPHVVLEVAVEVLVVVAEVTPPGVVVGISAENTAYSM